MIWSVPLEQENILIILQKKINIFISILLSFYKSKIYNLKEIYIF